MAYALNGFFTIEAAADDAGNARFLGGQAEQAECELRPPYDPWRAETGQRGTLLLAPRATTHYPS